MRTSGSILGLVIVIVIIALIYRAQFSRNPDGAGPPKQQIDVVGIKTDLLSAAQSERLYVARHGTYATLDELEKDGFTSFSGSTRRGYTFTAEIDGARRFKITAVPSDPSKSAWPTFTIDETMQLSQQ